MTRFAKSRQIYYVEEPIDSQSSMQSAVYHPQTNITVITPYMKWDNWTSMCKQYYGLLENSIPKSSLESAFFWIYSPYFVGVLDYFNPKMIIYDCMDELANFKYASPNLRKYEKELMAKSDIVFTGGKSLYESKKDLHRNIFCFPSAIDIKHFEKSFSKKTSIPEDIAGIKKPIVGFYGVIDERLDLDLIAKVAKQLSSVSFVFMGPIAKINPDALPKNPNIFYLGKKEYAFLPNYLKGIDITFMPFELNDATKYISPTKTLEFMAAHKPIISTPIYDVVREFSNVVQIVHTPEEMIQAINAYLHESDHQRKKRIQLQKKIVKMRTWDDTVRHMNQIMVDTFQKKSFLAHNASINSRGTSLPVAL
jgi:glycosyltransferase involved in cell wall biosynthesis